MTRGRTPAMQQYFETKSRYPDSILFFQMGDFYETFGEDAGLVARELDITLTSRGRDRSGERIPLAGVPVHAAEGYIVRLVRKGYRVAVCDQVEDPKVAKGVVRREVVRVITPGTIMDASLVGSGESSYLAGIATDRKNSRYGIAFLDISTGDFYVTESPSKGYGDLLSEIARAGPRECIVPADLAGELLAHLREIGTVVTPCGKEYFGEAEAGSLLSGQFGTPSLEGFGCGKMPAAIAAAGAVLRYAKETQKTDLSHVNRIRTRISADSMVLDSITLRNLEILEGIRRGEKDRTLLSVLDETETPMGRRLLRSWLTAPLRSREGINRRLDAVEFFVTYPVLRTRVRELLRSCADMERIAGRISFGTAGPRDLLALSASLERSGELLQVFTDGAPGVPEAVDLALQEIDGLPKISALIRSALVDDPPATAKSGGVIREGYDGTLDDLRRIARSGRNWIAEFQQKERERTGIKSLKVGYNRVFGYYLEVTRANLGSVPPEYERRQTTTGAERYTTPALKEKEALIANADERLAASEAELYAALIGTLQPAVGSLQATARKIGELDLFTSLAEVAQINHYTRPSIEEGARLIIREGRHPVVEQASGIGFVPNDTEMDSRSDQILIITGANMAGKSTYMRAVALICIMAQTGSFVPAAHTTVGVVDRIFSRVGAFDDLASGQSTFMVEMLELANILHNFTVQSLVILDEIGRGTSTLDGFAIARAVLEYLHGKGSAGPRTLFATHFHELVTAETELKRVKNYHFAVKESGKEVVFLRKLIPGATDRSYGIHVATLAGIPRAVTGRAEEVLVEALRSPQADGKRAPRYTQLLLIDAPEKEGDHPVVARIRDLDLNVMTPLEALMTLHDLQRTTGDDAE
ncbi:MAG: DNA mismatch repair protein MutS [Methanomicrobiaceae archaeon]|nr:DNA mismatch repair protein MutS [Methanomicrobiaceae archaeon]